MSKVRLYGNTSGYVDLQAPDVAGDVTITLPNATGPFALESYVDAAVAAIPAIAGIGSNVVQAVKTDTFTTASTSYTNVTGLSVTITPSSATAKVLLIAQVALGGEPSGFLAFSGGNTSGYIGDAASNRIQVVGFHGVDEPDLRTRYGAEMVSMVFLDSPATASATTYNVQARARSAGLTTINRTWADSDSNTVARMASSFTVIEVAA
jgi:hypothetical protein